ncbi:hypothetical protein N7456_006730 [Penicillium angulare]|uniref:DUF2786 domain-containing protein n=1 Tax=Penicillium angulare TaxID=116970 RepID=A0A9W9KC86_9EURO|nr:hypothetical protein N7456_006730 [Penicillium angulare]
MEPPPPHLKRKREPKTRKPIQKATLKSKATDTKKSNTKVEEKILERIEKCLSRAYHTNTSEQEAKTALLVAQRLMAQHNVTQADVMANDKEKNKSHYGGQSTVAITKINGSFTRVIAEAFVPKLARAMCIFFDCKYYSVYRVDRIEYLFYGIAENTVTAATAFEKEHNRILEWACEYKGGTATHSYRLGVADGLMGTANREKKRELEFAKRKEIEYINAIFDEVASATMNPQTVSDIDTGTDININVNINDNNDNSNSPLEIGTEGRLGSIIDHDRDSASASASFSNHGRSSIHHSTDRYTSNRDEASDSDCDENEDFSLNTDFNTKDVEVIDLCGDDIDDTIDRLVKREISELLPMPPPGPEAEPRIKTDPDTETREPRIQSIPTFTDYPLDRPIKRELSELPTWSSMTDTAMPPPPLPAGPRSSDTGLKREPVSELQDIPATDSSPWQSEMQLSRFRATSEQVANDYLKDQGIKLHSSKRTWSTAKDGDAYNRGRKDSSKINVRQSGGSIDSL